MFLNPFLLAGIAGISLPIIIHLLNQRKFQRIRWAAMRFIQTSLEKNRRRMQIEDLLLLALRCLIVALLATALARPTLQRAAALFGRPPVTAVILLDNSYSMGKTDGTTTRFDTAKKAADEVLASLPNGSSAALFLFSDAVRDVIAQPTSDLTLARDKVRQAALSDRSTNILTGLQRALTTLKNVPGLNKEIYLITDGQAVGWRHGTQVSSTQPSASAGDEAQILHLLQDTKNQVATHILLLPEDDIRNLSVSAVRLTTELPTINKVLRFEVEVSNHGNTDARDVPVRLFVDDNATPVEETVVDVVPARGSKSISLHARLRGEGFHGITARIAPDTLTTDDSRSIVVHALKQVQVLLVDGEAGREGREEDAFFVREALQPVAVDLRPAYFIQTRTITAAELPQTSFDSYDAIVLADVATLPRATVTALEKFLNDGRGLIVFPGPNVSTSFYNDTLYRDRGLLPAALGEAVGDSNQGERFETLQTSHFEHPIMTLWNDEGRGNPGVAHFFRMIDLRIDPAATTTHPAESAPLASGRTAIVANYANGKPAIVEHTFGEGRVVLFGSTANTQWNDLPVRASIFIPMMHRVLDSILEHQDDRLAIQVGQTFTWRTSTEALGKDAQIFRLTRPGDVRTDAAAPLDAVHVDMQGPWPVVSFDRTELGGIYKVSVDGAADEPVLFAVQPDNAESDLTPLSPVEIAQINAIAPVLSWKPGAALQRVVVADVGRELWWPLAAAVLAIAALETLLAYWFSRVK